MSHAFVNTDDDNGNNINESLYRYISIALESAVYQQLPIVTSSHSLCDTVHESNDDINADDVWLQEVIKVDNTCNSSISNVVSLRSSISQGKCFFRAAAEAFDYTNNNKRISMLENVLYGSSSCMHGHYATLFGAITGLLDVPMPLVERMFMRCILRDLLSAATRLNIVGALESAKIQAKFASVAESMLANRQNVTTSMQQYQTSPILEIMQGRHDIMYARLFNS